MLNILQLLTDNPPVFRCVKHGHLAPYCIESCIIIFFTLCLISSHFWMICLNLKASKFCPLKNQGNHNTEHPSSNK